MLRLQFGWFFFREKQISNIKIAGYVGQGCLSGAIAGSVFASPPPSSILAAILAVASKNPSGILVVSILA